MPYEKVAITVAVVITVVLTLMLGSNVTKDAPVAVIDLDNSKYSHEIIDKINATEHMKVSAVFNAPLDPNGLFYQDRNIAVIYLPHGLEKDRYSGTAVNVGVFYDNTNTALTAELKESLNEIIALDNAAARNVDVTTGSLSDRSLSGNVSLSTRNLFNPAGSSSNGEVQGFLFFFSSMFFTFATIGMIARLRLTGKLALTLQQGTPFDLMLRIVPYAGCLLTGIFIGMAILRILGDMVFAGQVMTFLFTQVCYIFGLGLLCQLMGWTAANPGIAASRMILFIPGGFILGGPTGPISAMYPATVAISHIFPLTWEFHFVRDVVTRGAGLTDIMGVLGGYFIYLALIMGVYFFVFNKARRNLLADGNREVLSDMEG